MKKFAVIATTAGKFRGYYCGQTGQCVCLGSKLQAQTFDSPKGIDSLIAALKTASHGWGFKVQEIII